jgi:hypothetical protein
MSIIRVLGEHDVPPGRYRTGYLERVGAGIRLTVNEMR